MVEEYKKVESGGMEVEKHHPGTRPVFMPEEQFNCSVSPSTGPVLVTRGCFMHDHSYFPFMKMDMAHLIHASIPSIIITSKKIGE